MRAFLLTIVATSLALAYDDAKAAEKKDPPKISEVTLKLYWRYQAEMASIARQADALNLASKTARENLELIAKKIQAECTPEFVATDGEAGEPVCKEKPVIPPAAASPTK